jgi:hypothetical protein
MCVREVTVYDSGRDLRCQIWVRCTEEQCHNWQPHQNEISTATNLPTINVPSKLVYDRVLREAQLTGRNYSACVLVWSRREKIVED